MLPTLAHRQHVQTLPLPPECRRKGTERGGIVAFHHPQKPQSVYIKRVVGLPNEHIALEDDRVLINGQPQPEPYLAPGSGTGRQYARQWFTDSANTFCWGTTGATARIAGLRPGRMPTDNRESMVPVLAAPGLAFGSREIDEHS